MNSASILKGMIVLVDVPYLDATRTVRRPAVIVGDTHTSLHRTLGQLTPATILEIDVCLKIALGIA